MAGIMDYGVVISFEAYCQNLDLVKNVFIYIDWKFVGLKVAQADPIIKTIFGINLMYP